MQPARTVSTAQLPDYLMTAAVVRPVFVWGPPGIGKSSLVARFAAEVGMECVPMLLTQMAPEDLIGVPQLVTGADGVTRTRFAPPELLARSEPFVLFLDEFNGAGLDTQKAAYQMVLEGRIGAWRFPAGTVAIAAGNRGDDMSGVKAMPAALVNRFVHLHLTTDTHDWLAWATGAALHPWVVEYIGTRPDHLRVDPPKSEAPFSTPRAWHTLSDLLLSATGSGASGQVPDAVVDVFAHGCLTAAHAAAFLAFVKMGRNAHTLDDVIAGRRGWPAEPGDRDVLTFLASSLRARMMHDLPVSKSHGSRAQVEFALRAKDLLVQLAEISLELAQVAVCPDDDDKPVLPAWFLAELVRDIPRLAQSRAGRTT